MQVENSAGKQNDHVPIVDLNKRRKSEEEKLLPHEQNRYKEGESTFDVWSCYRSLRLPPSINFSK